MTRPYYRLVDIRPPANLDAFFGSTEDVTEDVNLIGLADRRLKARKLTKIEWDAYARWLRLRRRQWCGDHRQREVLAARRHAQVLMFGGIAREQMLALFRPFKAIERAFADPVLIAAIRKVNDLARPYRSPALGRRIMFELDGARRLERHFEIGGGS